MVEIQTKFINMIYPHALRVSVLLLLLITTVPAHGQNRPPLDITAAKELCDRSPLDPVEGLWTFSEENLLALIRRVSGQDMDGNYSNQLYCITVVDTPDVTLIPGDTIGWIEASPDPSKFKMTLFTRRKASTLMQPMKLMAELKHDNEFISVKAEKWGLRLNLLSFLRSFWRLVKLQHDNPLKNLPAGLIRKYPVPHGTAKRNNQPRYL